MWNFIFLFVAGFGLFWHMTHLPRHYAAARPVVLTRTHWVYTWKTAKAATIADVYGLTADDVSKPVDIFR